MLRNPLFANAFLIFAIAFATVAPAQTPPLGIAASGMPTGRLAEPARGMIGIPWAATPSYADYADVYPPGARTEGVEGHSEMLCSYTAQGILWNCTVASEYPPETGFGEALIRLAPKFRVATAPGTPGGTVRAGVAWTLERPPISLPPPFAVPPAINDGAQGPDGVAARSTSRIAVVTAPSWERKPTSEDIAKFYPPQALDLRAEGRAVIRCGVVADGTLKDCRVVSEDPPALGFGKATVQLGQVFKMSPKTTDGRSVEGGVVTIPITWRLH